MVLTREIDQPPPTSYDDLEGFLNPKSIAKEKETESFLSPFFWVGMSCKTKGVSCVEPFVVLSIDHHLLMHVHCTNLSAILALGVRFLSSILYTVHIKKMFEKIV